MKRSHRIILAILQIVIILGIVYFAVLRQPEEPEQIGEAEVYISEGLDIDTESAHQILNNSTADVNVVDSAVDTHSIPDITEAKEEFTLDDIDLNTFGYDNPYIIVNNNEPFFDELTTDVFEEYSELDNLGRCGVAYANICLDLMPTDKRGEISKIYPSGWKTNGKSNNNKYDTSLVDGGYIYNRSHLIGFQLAGENANELNLITGTRFFNVNGMLPFENIVDDYIEENLSNHVMYRVTPYYRGDNLVADGVLMEAKSVEDNGEGICFNVFVANVQPGIEINYLTGENNLK